MDWVDKWVEMIAAEEAAEAEAEREIIRYWAMCFFEEHDDDGISKADYLERFRLEYGYTASSLIDDEITRIRRDMGEYMRYRFPSLSEVERLKRVANVW